MFKFKAIDHINMFVRNLDETQSFYEKYFGFTLKESGDNYRIIGLKDKFYICMHEKAENKMNHLGFHLENFEESYQLVLDENLPMPYPLTQYPESKSFYLEDPNGYQIEISEFFAGGLT